MKNGDAGMGILTVRRAIWLATVATTALISPGGHAQSRASEHEVSEVVVTGSRIRSSDAGSANPVTMVTRDEIERTNTTSLDQLLLSVPAAGTRGQTGSSSPGQQIGAYAVDLRNLNPNRTLFLVNGRRFVPIVGVSGIVVDMSNIPVAFVDHVEVLRDGASPLYGSDAIAGVINIITKKNVEGLSVDVSGGVTGHGDRETGEISTTYGRNFSAGNVTFNLDYVKRGNITTESRSFAYPNITAQRFGTDGSVINTIGSSTTFGGTVATAGTPQFVITGPGKTAAYTTALNQPRVNYDISAPDEHAVASTIGEFELGKDVTFFFEGTYAYHSTASHGSNKNVSANAAFPNGALIPASNPYNFFGVPVTVSRYNGSKTFFIDGDTYRLVGGFRGKMFDRFEWEVAYNYGRATSKNQYLSTSYPNFYNAVDPVKCAAAPGCVLANFFGQGALSKEAADYIFKNLVVDRWYTQDSLTASMTGELFQVPAGAVSFAAGVERRNEAYHSQPNAFQQSIDSGTAVPPSGGDSSVNEVFGELRVPILKDIPFVKAVNFDGSIRYSEYRLSGGAMTWKAGLDWALNDTIRIRAGMSSSFRAPGLDEIYNGLTSITFNAVDPCDTARGQRGNATINAACTAQGARAGFAQVGTTITGYQSGNADLQPETSRNANVGIVLTPSFVPGLAITADYFKVDVHNAIAAPDYNFVLTQCYLSGAALSSPFCGGVSRFATGTSVGQLQPLLLKNANLGGLYTDGFDFSVSYRMPLNLLWKGADGTVGVDLQGEFLSHYRVQNQPGGDRLRYDGTLGPQSGVFGSYPRDKENLTFSYSSALYDLNWRVRSIASMRVYNVNPLTAPTSSVPRVYYSDLSGRVRLNTSLELRAGIDNLFDRQPPFIVNGYNYDAMTYDVSGRSFWLKASYKF